MQRPGQRALSARDPQREVILEMRQETSHDVLVALEGPARGGMATLCAELLATSPTNHEVFDSLVARLDAMIRLARVVEMEGVIKLIVPQLDPGALTLGSSSTRALAESAQHLQGEALLQELVAARDEARQKRMAQPQPLLIGRSCVLASLCGAMVARGAKVPNELVEALLLLIEVQLPPFCMGPCEGNAFLSFPLRCTSECLARLQPMRELARRHHSLLVGLEESLLWRGPAGDTLQRLIATEDARLLLLAPAWGVGWEIALHGVLNLYHLFSLLQAMLFTTPARPLLDGAFIKQPSWLPQFAMNCMPGLASQVEGAELYDNAQLEFWHWSAMQAVLSDGGHIDRSVGYEALERHALKQHGGTHLSDLDTLEGYQVLIVTSLLFPKSWDVMAFQSPHQALKPHVAICEKLSESEVREWLHTAKLSCAHRAASELMKDVQVYEAVAAQRKEEARQTQQQELSHARQVLRERSEEKRHPTRCISRAAFDLVLESNEERYWDDEDEIL